MDMKKILEFLKFIGLLLWQLPQSIIGWLMMLYFVIFGKVRTLEYKWGAYVFESDLMIGAISLGTVIICSKYCAKRPEDIQHELGHVKQSHMLGLLYLFIIGIPSITWAGIYKHLGFKNYYQFYTESWANKLGYVEVVNYKDSYYYIRRIKNILDKWELF